MQPKITIIWCTVPEIWSETDKIFCYFGPFFSLLLSPNDPEYQDFEKKWKKCLEIVSFYKYMCTINEHHLIFGCWNIRCDREIFNILGHSLHFSLLTTWKIKIITLKKTLGDIIILHICTIFTCMVHEIWSATDIIFCHSRPFFALLPPNNPKNQNFEKMKKLPGDIITFQTCDINGNHMMYGSWNIEHDGQNFLSIWTILCTFTLLTTWKIKILKKF